MVIRGQREQWKNLSFSRTHSLIIELKYLQMSKEVYQ